jgi:hypothetical protein
VNKFGGVAAALALAVLLVGSTAAATQASGGFAAYQVTVISPKGSHSVVINETVSPSSKAGYQDLVLQFIGGVQNLTYSRVVNTTADLFPYVPTVTNQTFDYSNGTLYSVHVHVTVSSSISITFRGSQYTLSVLTITATGSYGNHSASANGTVETFPSTLVYSASVGNSTYGLQSVLQNTDLPLVPTSSQMTTAAEVGAGAVVGVAALGGVFLLRRRERKVSSQGEKPLHWVD